jgi:serralysin
MTIHAFNPIFSHFSFLVLSAVLYLGFSTAEAKELWVDVLSLGGACSDARTREEVGATTPWCSLDPAGDQAIAGDVVTVRKGTYSKVQNCGSCNGNSVLQVVNSGTSSAWIRFRAFPGEKVVISGSGGARNGIQIRRTYDGRVPSYVSVQGFEVNGFQGYCLSVNQTADVIFTGLDIHGCSRGAVELHETARVTLEDSRIHDNGLTGWTSAVDLYRCRQGNVVRRNRIWANTDLDSRETEGHGVIMDYCENNGSAIIESNVIWQNEGMCIHTVNSSNGVIRNNTCWMNGKGRSTTGEISIIRGGTNHSIHNNILQPRPGRLAINVSGGSQALAEYNLANGDWVLGRPDYLDFINEDPMLVNPSAGDFHLGAGSPAIDSGDNANAATIDADGNSRPQDGSGLGYAMVDLGAYEYVQNGTGGGSTGGDSTGGDSTGGGSTDGGDSSASPTAPTLLSAKLAGNSYELAWSAPNTPDGGYDIVIDGVDTNSQHRTSGLQASIGGLDTGVEHCFRIQSRYVELGEFPTSGELCAQPTSDPGTGGSGGATSEFIVDFDAPTPPGSSNALLSGVFEGIDFGQGQWRWEGAWKANPSNHVFFDSSSGQSRNFQFARSPAVLTSMRVNVGASGVLTLSDDAGQTFTTSLSEGGLVTIETGWTQAAKTVTVNYSAGWELAVDDIKYLSE